MDFLKCKDAFEKKINNQNDARENNSWVLLVLKTRFTISLELKKIVLIQFDKC